MHNSPQKIPRGFPVRKSVLAMSGVLLYATATPGLAAADEAMLLEEVVVTGSLIRGIESTGSNKISLDSAAIGEIGATSAADVLATVPQASNLFNDRATVDPAAASQNTIIKPNLRDLPGVTQASGSTTLLLIDGHRSVGMGVINASPDPDIVPPAVLERVEVITDGGSSLYGADAVGGVINFITKKDFEGVQIDLGYGSGDDYDSYDVSLTAGKAWDGGSAYISGTRAEHDSILGGDRDWARGGVWTDSGVMSTAVECIDPVGSVQNFVATDFGGLIAPATVWGFNGPAVFTGTPCDQGELGVLLPEEERNNVYFGINQELNDQVELEVKAFWSEKESLFAHYPLGAQVGFGPTRNQITGSPFLPVGAMTQGGSVGFSFDPHPAYNDQDDWVNTEAWGITPTLTIDMASGWQLRTLVHYSESESERLERSVNASLLNSLVGIGAIDPLDIASASANDINAVLNWELNEASEQELFIARFVADGAVMELPAGEMRAALGFEFFNETARLRRGIGEIGFLENEDYPEARRDVRAFFAEMHIPLLSDLPAVESLVLSASARYDEYSDFGSTTNPTVSLTWEPVDWVSMYVSWGESFNAPTLMDTLQALGAQSFYNPNTATFGGIGAVVSDEMLTLIGNDTVQIRGANAGLEPQTAKTWAAGLAVSPLEGLDISLNYYDIEFVNLLAFPNPTSASSMRANRNALRFNSTANPLTQQELEDFLDLSFNAEDTLAQIINLSDVGTLLDLRLANTNEAYLKGFDFAINYYHDTSFGVMTYGLSGNHSLEYDEVRGGVREDTLVGKPDTRWTASVGLQSGNWRSKLTWKHTDSFDAESAALDPVSSQPVQSTVDDFDVFDLFVGYDFNGGSGFTEGLSLRFNVDNLLDEDPPVYRKNNDLPVAGFTLGRVFKVGVTKTFD